jgi:hypothetical protein
MTFIVFDPSRFVRRGREARRVAAREFSPAFQRRVSTDFISRRVASATPERRAQASLTRRNLSLGCILPGLERPG